MTRWAWIGLLVVACGSNGPVVRHQVPMKQIWHTPPEARADVAAAFKALQVAEAQLAHTRFLLDDTRRQRSIAAAERDRARADIRIVELRKERHLAAYRKTQVSAADKELSSYKSQKLTYDRKLAWLERRESYLTRELSRLEIETHAAEAKLELAKAELAVRLGAIPKTELQSFKTQAQRAERRATAARKASQDALQKSRAARKAWEGG